MRVTETMGPAWETMKRLLFRPFNIGTWFAFGLIFQLQDCVEGGGGNFNVPNGNSFGGGSGSGHPHGGSSDNDIAGLVGHVLGSVSDPLRDVFKSSLRNTDMATVAIVGVVAVAIFIPILLLMYWLGSRGQMMAIQAVATGRAEVGQLWSATKPAGNALFKFTLAIGVVSLVLMLPCLVGGFFVVKPVIMDGARIESVLPMLVLVGVALVVLLLPFALVSWMLRTFVAPLMLKHGLTAREGWKRFWAIGKDHVGGIVGFFFLRVVVHFCAVFVGVIASVLTCCLGFLPVLHQTLMAPYYIFERAWTLEALASMSPDFDLRGGGGMAPSGGMPYGGPGPAPYNPYGGAPGENPYAPPGYGGYGGNQGGGYGGPPPGGFGSPQ